MREQRLPLTLLHSARPKLFTILTFLRAIGLRLYNFELSECNRVKILTFLSAIGLRLYNFDLLSAIELRVDSH